MIHYNEYDPDELADGFILDAESLEDQYAAQDALVADLAGRLADGYQDMVDPTAVIDAWWDEQAERIADAGWEFADYSEEDL